MRLHRVVRRFNWLKSACIWGIMEKASQGMEILGVEILGLEILGLFAAALTVL